MLKLNQEIILTKFLKFESRNHTNRVGWTLKVSAYFIWLGNLFENTNYDANPNKT